MSKNFLVISFFLFLISCSGNTNENLITFTGTTMGTVYSIKIVKEEGKQNLYDGLQQQIDMVLKEVNMKMSTYIETSEISLFNKSKANEWKTLSEDLAVVISKAEEIYRLSQGAFDITVGPLVNLWGFGPEKRDDDIPSDSTIMARKKNVGMDKIHLDSQNLLIKKDLDGIYCDLSAIAKGYGVDKVGEFLSQKGIKNYMVEIGGEVRTSGKNHKGEPWKIGVTTPDNDLAIQEIIPLSNLTMATSGDYRNYFEKDGVRYSHTIDPRTGRPITHNLASVTVIHENCMTADAAATAIDVLGPDDGMALAQKMNIAVYMIIRSDSGFVERMNSRFEEFLHQ